jgi:methyltransferase (TIGR00027 family)
MTNQTVENKPSETAMFAALRRFLAHKEFQNESHGPDHLAEFFLPPNFRFLLKFKGIRKNTKKRLNGFLPGLNEYMIARTAHFDKLFADALRSEIPQIVLLGAGYDTRAFRYAGQNQGTRIFELDIAPTQERKVECLKQAKIEIPPQVTFVPIDFNRESLEDVLKEAGFQADLRTLFIWEGVSYYLDAGAVDATLAFFSRATQQDSLLAFDYTISINQDITNDSYGVKEFAQTMQEHHANEALTFSIDEGMTTEFLEERGLRLVDHLDNKEIEKTYLVENAGTLIGRITGHFRFVTVGKS